MAQRKGMAQFQDSILIYDLTAVYEQKVKRNLSEEIEWMETSNYKKVMPTTSKTKSLKPIPKLMGWFMICTGWNKINQRSLF